MLPDKIKFYRVVRIEKIRVTLLCRIYKKRNKEEDNGKEGYE